MKALVVYDSVFGNTAKVAEAIGEALGAETLKVDQVQPGQLEGVELLVAGSPTRAFRATPAMLSFLRGLQGGSLKGVRVAAFDTRMDVEKTDSAVLSFFVKIFGYAAEPMLKLLQRKGGQAALAAEGFIVVDTEGPMKENELERAADWARSVLK